MLKIKDDVDLKELENYGFKYHAWMTPDGTYHKLKKDGTYTKKTYTKFKEIGEGTYSFQTENELDCGYRKYSIYEINTIDREINIRAEGDDLDGLMYTNDDLLFDLIKDGLVEKALL